MTPDQLAALLGISQALSKHRDRQSQGMQSLVVLPLVLQDRCLGALGFMASTADGFASHPQRLLDEIASSGAIALDGCLAYAQLQRRARCR